MKKRIVSMILALVATLEEALAVLVAAAEAAVEAPATFTSMLLPLTLTTVPKS